jgi:L-malate glycosyltransferase
MRVLHFIKGLGRGGAETLLVQALRHIDLDRFEFEYAYMLPHRNALVAELRAQGARVHLVPGQTPSRLVSAPWRLSRLVRERQIDLIHAHLPVAGMVARVAAGVSGTPVLYTEHNMNERYTRLTRWGNRLTWPLNSACAAVSGPVADSIRATMPSFLGTPVRTILNGIDVTEFSAPSPARDVRRQLGIAAAAPTVITVAVFRLQKRLDLWLDVAESVRRSLPDAQFVMVGDGPLRGEVESWRRARGLEDRVHLVGLQQDVKPYLAAADVFLSTSDFEGLPLAVIEAMAAGLPVVATRAGGVPDLVGQDEGAGGILAARGDVDGLTRGTVALLSDPRRRRAVGEAGRDRVRRHFGVERMVQAYQDLYEAVLALR